MSIIQRIKEAYRINARMYNLGIAFIVASLITRFPWLIGWLNKPEQDLIFQFAYETPKIVIGLVLFWAKDKTVSGNGTYLKPFTKKK